MQSEHKTEICSGFEKMSDGTEGAEREDTARLSAFRFQSPLARRGISAAALRSTDCAASEAWLAHS